MNHSDFSNLRFDRPQRAIPSRLVWVGLLMAGFSLAWIILPHTALFWLVLILVGTLGWAASYGWRQAVRVLTGWLDRIQNL